MLTMSNMGDQVWLMTSRQTEPDNSSMLAAKEGRYQCELADAFLQTATRRSLPRQAESSQGSTRAKLTVKDLVGEPDRRRLVRVPLGQLDVDLPHAVFEGGWRRGHKRFSRSVRGYPSSTAQRKKTGNGTPAPR